ALRNGDGGKLYSRIDWAVCRKSEKGMHTIDQLIVVPFDIQIGALAPDIPRGDYKVAAKLLLQSEVPLLNIGVLVISRHRIGGDAAAGQRIGVAEAHIR